MSDIFISYRRKDSESFAYLLYKDLTNDGYSVFFDHKNLGAGDFKKAIEENIKESKDIILVVTKSSFGDKIFDCNDIYRYEIETALHYNKNIIGIMLEGFNNFPPNLPKSIDRVRNINCLKMHMEYYEAMYLRLTSGNFLISVSSSDGDDKPTDIAINNTTPEELQSLTKLDNYQRNNCMELLLHIMDSFNKSEMCMRFYHYIDLIDRSKGLEDMPIYKGLIPTDLVTYLAFFETLYVVVASKTINIEVIDYMYRFRFFAGCNNLLMQESELLPLGYQYPNIISFYNLWSEYIVNSYNHEFACKNVSEEIPGYEYDLHKRYAVFCFVNRINKPMLIRFLNRKMEWLTLTLKLIEINRIKESIDLQKEIIGGIIDNDKKNIFEDLSNDEMFQSIKDNVAIGLYKDDNLVAQINVLFNILDQNNIILDLLPNNEVSLNAAIIDYVVVKEDYRGFGIQNTLLFAAECLAKKYGKKGICAVTSPLNVHSTKNFVSQGYKILATLPKYKSERHYLWKTIK